MKCPKAHTCSETLLHKDCIHLIEHPYNEDCSKGCSHNFTLGCPKCEGEREEFIEKEEMVI